MFYIIRDEKLNSWSDYKYDNECQETNIITKQELDEHPNKVVVENGVLVLNPNYEEEEQQEERKRINMLSLTKREVFLAIYKDKQITPDQIREMITSEEGKIEFDYANDYFRGNPLIDQLGEALGYNSEELDYLFENKEFPKKEDNK